MASGTIAQTSSSNSNVSTRIVWSSTSNNTTNVSTVTASLQVQKLSGTSSTLGTFSGTLTINGISKSVSQYGTWAVGTWEEVGSNSVSVSHNTDGSKSININGSLTQTGTTLAGTFKQSGTAILDSIPRATQLSDETGTIGSALSISWSRASSSFTHTLKYTFGSLSGTIGTGLGTSTSWTIPTTFYAQIPNAKSGTGTLTLQTYNDSTLVGTSTATLTATCNESACKPTITASVVDSNSTTKALTGNSAKLIKAYSTALITPTITTENSATLKTKALNNTEFTSTTVSILKTTVSTFSITATDSRGYSTTVTVGFSSNLIDYAPLTLNNEISRPSQVGNQMVMNFNGNFYNQSFGSVSNVLVMSLAVREQGSTNWTTIKTLVNNTDYKYNGNTYNSGATTSQTNIYIDNPLISTKVWDYKKAYEFRTTFSDKLSTSYDYITVIKGEPVANWFEKDDNKYFNINGILNRNGESFVKDVLTSTSSNDSLSANQGKLLNDSISALASSLGLGGIDSSTLNASGGYIRFKNGFTINWKAISATLGGAAWGYLYYSDHSMGNWTKPFSVVFSAFCNINSNYYWGNVYNHSTTSAGIVRALRATSTTSTGTLYVVGIGIS